MMLKRLLAAAWWHQEAGADPGAGPHLLPLLHALPRRRDPDASPWRPLHYLLCPRAHSHPGEDCSQGIWDIHINLCSIWNIQLSKERINAAKVATCLLLVTGVVLVCRPPFLFHSNSYKSIIEVKLELIIHKNMKWFLLGWGVQALWYWSDSDPCCHSLWCYHECRHLWVSYITLCSSWF